MARRPPSELEQRWQEIFDNPLLTPETFRASGTSFSSNTCLRSVFWRVWLGRLPLPAARNRYSGSFSPAWRHYISTTRAEYDELAQKHLSNPESSPLLQQGESQDQAQLHTVQSDTHPLSLQADSPWQHYHASQELRVQIVKDVERTYPENDFFRNAQVQEIMTDLLLIWSILSDFGYRQGIHELLGCLLEAVWADSLDSSDVANPTSSSLSLCHTMLDHHYIRHDTYALFSRLMMHARSLYDPSPSIPVAMPGSSNSFKVEQPIVAQCHRIINITLANIDPALTSHLNKLGIEPQLFALRWLRLLFTREFPFQDALFLWDCIFSEDATLKIADFIVIAMLLRHRSELLSAEYAETLQLLLRYPAPDDGEYHIEALFHQAKLLRDNPTPTGADLVRQQNIALGFGGGATPRESRSPVSSTRRFSLAHRQSDSPSAHPSVRSPTQGAFDLAKGVYARAEAYGINRAIGDFAKSWQYSAPVGTDLRSQQQLSPSRHEFLRQAAEIDGLRQQYERLLAMNQECAAGIGLCASALDKKETTSNADLVSLLQSVQKVLSASVHEDNHRLLREEMLKTIKRLEPSMAAGLSATSSSANPSQSSTSRPSLSSRTHSDISSRSSQEQRYTSTSPSFPASRLSRSVGHTRTQSAFPPSSSSQSLVSGEHQAEGESSYPPLKGLRRKSLAMPSPPAEAESELGMQRSKSKDSYSIKSPNSQFQDPLGALG